MLLTWDRGVSEVESWNWGADNPASSSSFSSGRASFRALSLVRSSDAQSVDFLARLATGDKLTEVKLENNLESLTLNDVVVTGYSSQAAQDGSPASKDWIQLRFDSYEYSRTGGRACWNITNNAPC